MPSPAMLSLNILLLSNLLNLPAIPLPVQLSLEAVRRYPFGALGLHILGPPCPVREQHQEVSDVPDAPGQPEGPLREPPGNLPGLLHQVKLLRPLRLSLGGVLPSLKGGPDVAVLGPLGLLDGFQQSGVEPHQIMVLPQ